MQKHAKTTLYILLIVDFIVIGLHLLFGGFNDFFNLDQEYNLPTYYSGIKLMALSGLIIFFASKRTTYSRWIWLPASLLFAYIAIDEVLVIHEKSVENIGSDLFSPLGLFAYHGFYWVILFLPLIILSVSYLYLLIQEMYRKKLPGARAYLMGLGLFVLVILMELLGGLMSGDPTIYSYLFLVEESAEILGATSFIYGTLRNMWIV